MEMKKINSGKLRAIGYDARVSGNGHNEAQYARSPLLNPLPQAGEEANESLREFHVTASAGKNPLDELFRKP